LLEFALLAPTLGKELGIGAEGLRMDKCCAKTHDNPSANAEARTSSQALPSA
jgi:hypothetical protein